MNIRRWGLLTVLVLTIGGMTPIAQASTTAACGTTPGQWTGTFKGTKHYEGSSRPDYTVDLRITSDSTGLRVRTIINGSFEYAQYGPTTINNGKIRWVTRLQPLPPYVYTAYSATSVTCAGERVTAFNGTFTVSQFPSKSYEMSAGNTFSVTRTG